MYKLVINHFNFSIDSKIGNHFLSLISTILLLVVNLRQYVFK